MSSTPVSALTSVPALESFNPIAVLLMVLITPTALTTPETRASAVARLATLASLGQGNAIREAFGIPILVASLLEKDATEKCNALDALVHLSKKNPLNRKAIRKAKAIRILNSFLHWRLDSPCLERMKAIAVLANLSCDDPINQKKIAAIGIIRYSLQCLAKEYVVYAEEEENLMRILFNLSFDEVRRAEILKHPKILQILENYLPWRSGDFYSKSHKAKEWAAGLLSNLVLDSDVVKIALCNSGILRGLAKHLRKSFEQKSKEYAALALRNLTQAKANQDVIGQTSLNWGDLLPSLDSEARDPLSPMARELLLEALWNLSVDHPVNNQLILKHGGINLARCLLSDSSKERHYAAAILRNIALYSSAPGLKEQMVCKLVPSLSICLARTDIPEDERAVLNEVLFKINSLGGESSDALAFGSSSGVASAGAGAAAGDSFLSCDRD